MKKALKSKIIALTAALSCTISLDGATSVCAEQPSYVPLWMQPNTVIVYDDQMDYDIIQGGELTEADIVGREDIAAVGLTSNSPDMLASPNIKVEYDHHGFIQNIYYPSSSRNGEYQLSNPARPYVGSGIMDAGTTYTYPDTYYNYDTGKSQHCTLTRSADGKTMTGVGRITFFTGSKGEGGTHTLQAYDCATKMYKDDVAAGTVITATNTVTGESQKYYKYDVGGMPGAILDIWSNSTTNPITDITTSGKIDNVYSATIKHDVK